MSLLTPMQIMAERRAIMKRIGYLQAQQKKWRRQWLDADVRINNLKVMLNGNK